MSNLDPREYKSWTYDGSTRENTHLLTAPFPVDETLSVADTAQDLITVSQTIPTINMITNPSCESGSPPTGYSAVLGATLARDGTYKKYGSYSLSIVPPDVARGEGAYWNLGAYSSKNPLSISAYFSRGTGSGSDARIELVASTLTGTSYTDVRIQVGNTITLDTTWQRSQLVSSEGRYIYIFSYTPLTGTFSEDETITGGTSGATATVMTVGSNWLAVSSPSAQFSPEITTRKTETITGASSLATGTLSGVQRMTVEGNLKIYFVTATKHGTTFYMDNAQAEMQDNVTDYCDGSMGYAHFWDSTAHASVSRRWKHMSNIRSYRFHTTRDIYLAYDRVASNSSAVNAEDRGEYIPAGTDFGESFPIYLTQRMSFINKNPSELPHVYGVVWGI